jgi:hypothetical protein
MLSDLSKIGFVQHIKPAAWLAEYFKVGMFYPGFFAVTTAAMLGTSTA